MSNYIYKVAKSSLRNSNTALVNIKDIKIGIYLHIYQLVSIILLVGFLVIKNNF
jgi:hypothetical protein